MWKLEQRLQSQNYDMINQINYICPPEQNNFTEACHLVDVCNNEPSRSQRTWEVTLGFFSLNIYNDKMKIIIP